MGKLKRYMPIFDWGQDYSRSLLGSDLLAAVIVTIMLIPQSLAYALLAGLPPEVGLYASILPLVAYGLFGSSRTLAVGPVAVVSLMTATSVGQIADGGTAEYIAAAILLAAMSGIFLLLMGFFRMGFLANFLSHPVIAGFITASGILIAFSQLKHLLGISSSGHNLLEIIRSVFQHLEQVNVPTLVIGVVCIVFLFWVRSGLKPLLQRLGLSEFTASLLSRTGPVVIVVATSLAAYMGALDQRGVALVGQIPAGLPGLVLPDFLHSAWRELFVSAVLISLIGFVESVSVGHTLAAKRKQRISPDQELIGLGAANVASAFSGGYPVTGGFARSVVNFDAGAQTPAAGMFTAIGIALAALFLTPYLAYLPKATLAATIIVAVLALIDLGVLRRTWRYSRSDFTAVAITIFCTLALGVEIGVASGVFCSLALHLYKTTRPHMAVVGEVAGTRHFRNIDRHQVETFREILSLRIDESLYFANASFVEDKVHALLAEYPDTRHVVLMCNAVNEIDYSALEVMESINERLKDSDIKLHLSEVKGPVMDMLQRTHFIQALGGKVFLSHHDAIKELSEGLYGESNWVI